VAVNEIRPATYTVVKGDRLDAIAKKHGVDPQELRRLNPLPDHDFIYEGQVIRLPTTAPSTPSISAPTAAREIWMSRSLSSTAAMLETERNAHLVFEALLAKPQQIERLKRRLGVGNPAGTKPGVEIVGPATLQALMRASERVGYPLNSKGLESLKATYRVSEDGVGVTTAMALLNAIAVGRVQPPLIDSERREVARLPPPPERTKPAEPREPAREVSTTGVDYSVFTEFPKLRSNGTVNTPRYDDSIIAAAAGTHRSARQRANDPRVEGHLIKAVMMAESSFNPLAESKVPRRDAKGKFLRDEKGKKLLFPGAQGLMQLMPETGAQYHVGDPWDPKKNIRAGTDFIRDLTRQFDGNIVLVLASYNWGPARVQNLLDHAGKSFSGDPDGALAYLKAAHDYAGTFHKVKGKWVGDITTVPAAFREALAKVTLVDEVAGLSEAEPYVRKVLGLSRYYETSGQPKGMRHTS
jgi:soluble lytic murein transglycosylase-like protein